MVLSQSIIPALALHGKAPSSSTSASSSGKSFQSYSRVGGVGFGQWGLGG